MYGRLPSQENTVADLTCLLCHVAFIRSHFEQRCFCRWDDDMDEELGDMRPAVSAVEDECLL